MPGPTLIQKVLQQASSKSLPDVLMLDNPEIQQIAETGALAPLEDYGINAEGYAPGPVAAATYDGKLYGLQPGANTLAIFYNKEVLEKAGVEPPTTWDELKTTAKKLTVDKQYGFAFNATADYEGAWQFLPPMWTNGGDETNLTSPEVAGALQLWKDLVDEGSVSKSAVNWKQADVNDQFIAGKAAMMLNGPWQIPALDRAKINYGVVPFPVNTPGQTSVAPLGGEAWTVPLTARRGEDDQGRRTGQVHEHRREPDAAGQGGRPGADQARPGRSVQDRGPVDGRLRRRGGHGSGPHRKARAPSGPRRPRSSTPACSWCSPARRRRPKRWPRPAAS